MQAAELERELSSFPELEAAVYLSTAEARRLYAQGESGAALQHLYRGWQRYLNGQRERQTQMNALEQNLRARSADLEGEKAALQELARELNHSKEQIQLEQEQIDSQRRSIEEREQRLYGSVNENKPAQRGPTGGGVEDILRGLKAPASSPDEPPSTAESASLVKVWGWQWQWLVTLTNKPS